MNNTNTFDIKFPETYIIGGMEITPSQWEEQYLRPFREAKGMMTGEGPIYFDSKA